MLKSPGTFQTRRTIAPASRFFAAFMICIVLVAAGGVGGYVIGRKHPSATASLDGADLTTFWKAWSIIDSKFYGDTSVDKRLEGAISGMVSGLGDQFTIYLEPAQNKVFQQDLQGSFGGIGAELSVKNGQLVVQTTLSGTPSEKAGLKPNDIIVKIDGKDASKLTFLDAVNAVRGQTGTTITLNILHVGADKPVDIPIVRDVITVKSVTTDVLGVNKDVGYIKVNEFGQDTASAFRAALSQAVTDKRTSLVIDLRNNPGGYLQAALEMIGMVLPQTTTSTEKQLINHIGVTEKGKDGDTNLPAGTEAITPTLPMVVLVDAGSASASEIFSGAMKDYKRATVLGVKTFGKGSVQELQDLGNGGSIKVTVAKWFTPLGTGIDGKGIEPDVTVALPADTTASTSDVQIQKALDILTKK